MENWIGLRGKRYIARSKIFRSIGYKLTPLRPLPSIKKRPIRVVVLYSYIVIVGIIFVGFKLRRIKLLRGVYVHIFYPGRYSMYNCFLANFDSFY